MGPHEGGTGEAKGGDLGARPEVHVSKLGLAAATRLWEGLACSVLGRAAVGDEIEGEAAAEVRSSRLALLELSDAEGEGLPVPRRDHHARGAGRGKPECARSRARVEHTQWRVM